MDSLTTNANVYGLTDGSAQGIKCFTFVKSRVGPIFYYPPPLCLIISTTIVINQISITHPSISHNLSD